MGGTTTLLHDRALPVVGAPSATKPMLLPLRQWGVEQALWLPGAAGNYASVPDAPSLDITGDISVVWYGALADWTPAAIQTLVSKYLGGANISWGFHVNPDGSIRFRWSANGSSLVADVGVAGPSVTNGHPIALAVELDVDDGAGNRVVKFWTAEDFDPSAADPVGAATWTQLGATSTTAGTTSIFAGVAALEVGARASGTVEPCKGAVKYAAVYSGRVISSTATVAASFNFADPTEVDGDTWTTPEGHTATINRTGDATAELVDRNCWAHSLSHEFIYATDAPALNPEGDFTLLEGFSSRLASNGRRMFNKRGGSGSGYILLTATNRVDAYIQTGSGSVQAVGPAGAFDGQDHVVALERVGTAPRAWLDGVAGTLGSALAGSISNATNLLSARSDIVQQAARLVYWAALFDRSLSASEHAELATWDGTVATEPAWLRNDLDLVLYINADDPSQVAAYLEDDDVINLAGWTLAAVAAPTGGRTVLIDT